jgi:hypothetical protein
MAVNVGDGHSLAMTVNVDDCHWLPLLTLLSSLSFSTEMTCVALCGGHTVSWTASPRKTPTCSLYLHTGPALSNLAPKPRSIGERYAGNPQKIRMSRPRLASPITLGPALSCVVGHGHVSLLTNEPRTALEHAVGEVRVRQHPWSRAWC